MLLNRIEKSLMNNPLRAFVQRNVEARMLLAMGGPIPGGRALEIGCGRGVGTEIVLDVFRAERVDAFDLDPHMVALARRRLARRSGRVRVAIGDCTRIDADDGTYDAAFDFAIVHHVPDWRSALGEVHRVLKPGARFYAEEVLDRFILHPVTRAFLDHPLEDRFDAATFRRGLVSAGFRIVAARDLFGGVGLFVAEKS